MSMTLIKNGEIVTRERTSRYLCEAKRSRDRRESSCRRGSDRCDREICLSRFHRSARPHLSAVHGHVREGQSRDGEPRRARRRDDDVHRDDLPRRERDSRWRLSSFGSSKARGNSACDFSFHMGVTRYRRRSGARLSRNRRGAASAASKSSSLTKARSA